MERTISVKVHPVVMLSILDSYERRNEDSQKVVGTLIGTVDSKNTVEVTDCFAVPHSISDDEVAMDLEFGRNMFEMKRKVNQNEGIVGWYSTGRVITEQYMLIHVEYYQKQVKNPILLLIDAGLSQGITDAKAYVSTSMGVPGKTKGIIFVPLKLEFVAYESERVGVEVMQAGTRDAKRITQLQDDLQSLYENHDHLKKMLETVSDYVQKVASGQQVPNPTLGRALAKVFTSVPKVDAELCEETMNSSLRDLLMLTYLSNLVKTQLQINEKIHNFL